MNKPLIKIKVRLESHWGNLGFSENHRKELLSILYTSLSDEFCNVKDDYSDRIGNKVTLKLEFENPNG